MRPAGSITQQELVAEELPVLEKLYRVAPRGQRFEVMRELRSAGITSATQIQLMGRTGFINRMNGSLDESVAAQVYRSARWLSAVAVTLQLRHNSDVPKPGFAALPQRYEHITSEESGIFSWEAFFGGRSYCACDECQSAHGPAAYLADLLFWLKGRSGGGDHLATLRARRPDIELLRLSCKNALCMLPTIDLLIELLESLLAPSGASLSRQTTNEEAELAARPEHVHDDAYEKLAEPKLYPFELPYVLWLDQVRSFLSALGVERATLQMSFVEGGTVAALARPEIAAEVLGMSRTSWAWLSGSIDATVRLSVGASEQRLHLDPRQSFKPSPVFYVRLE